MTIFTRHNGPGPNALPEFHPGLHSRENQLFLGDGVFLMNDLFYIHIFGIFLEILAPGLDENRKDGRPNHEKRRGWGRGGTTNAHAGRIGILDRGDLIATLGCLAYDICLHSWGKQLISTYILPIEIKLFEVVLPSTAMMNQEKEDAPATTIY